MEIWFDTSLLVSLGVFYYARVVIFFISETYWTTFVCNFFHLTNCCFHPSDASGEGSLWAPNGQDSGGDPKVIFFITEAYATTFIINICWFFVMNIERITDTGQTDMLVEIVM